MWLVRCLHTVYPRRSHQFSGRNSADECPFSECPISSTFFKAGHSVHQQMSSESFTYFTMLLHTHFCICLSLSSFYLLSKIWLSSFSLIFNLLYIVPLSVCLSLVFTQTSLLGQGTVGIGTVCVLVRVMCLSQLSRPRLLNRDMTLDKSARRKHLNSLYRLSGAAHNVCLIRTLYVLVGVSSTLLSFVLQPFPVYPLMCCFTSFIPPHPFLLPCVSRVP